MGPHLRVALGILVVGSALAPAACSSEGPGDPPPPVGSAGAPGVGGSVGPVGGGSSGSATGGAPSGTGGLDAKGGGGATSGTGGVSPTGGAAGAGALSGTGGTAGGASSGAGGGGNTAGASGSAGEPSVPGRVFPTQACLDKASAVLAMMTADEKIAQLHQVERVDTSAADITQTGVGSIYSQGSSAPESNTPAGWADMIDGFRQASFSSRLGIPIIYGLDVVHGVGPVRGRHGVPTQYRARREPQSGVGRRSGERRR